MKIQISFFIILFFTSCNVRERPFVITKNYIVSYVKTNRFEICKYKNYEEYKKRLVDCSVLIVKIDIKTLFFLMMVNGFFLIVKEIILAKNLID